MQGVPVPCILHDAAYLKQSSPTSRLDDSKGESQVLSLDLKYHGRATRVQVFTWHGEMYKGGLLKTELLDGSVRSSVSRSRESKKGV